MQIFGHPWLESESFYAVSSLEEIRQTPSNTTIELAPLSLSLELAQYCYVNNIPYAIKVESISNAIFSNSLGAKFMLVTQELARELMPIAQNYLFDTHILAYVRNELDLEKMAKIGVDGIIYST